MGLRGGVKIGHTWVGPKHPCLVVGEAGVNHQGDVNLAKKMIRVAAECGVGAVKFQRRNIDAILTKAAQDAPYVNERSFGSTYGLHRRALELPDAAWLELKQVAHEHDLLFIATPYDPDSARFLANLGVAAIKIASCDVTNHPLLKVVADLVKPVILSTGMSTEDEIDAAVRIIWAGTEDLVLLNCTSTYPSEAKDLNLRYMAKMAKKFSCVVGHSGHEKGIQTSVAAVALGASVVERHFTMDRTMKGPDHAASLEPDGLRRLVRDIRRVEEAMVERPKKILPGEQAIRDRLGKSLVAARGIPAGAIIERSWLGVKGPGTGLAPYRLEELVGKRARVRIEADTLIAQEMVE